MVGKRRKPSDFEMRLGKIITMTRHRFGVSQKDLATYLGITFQQIQKYESATNHISADMLYNIAGFFDMTVGELIDGAQAEYIHDDTIWQTVELLYKMDKTRRRLILQVAAHIA